jgi:23S rRNA U2552 (ribose-2'-O)-methylase RlmE/FtsJ
MSKTYQPICMKIKRNNSNIFDTNNDVTLASNIDFPRFEYGFHHFIHQSHSNFKEKMLDKLEGKKHIYLVMNEFERYIDDYKESIGDESKSFFKLSGKLDIVDNDFYKIWEILFYFDLVSKSSSNFTSLHVSENVNEMAQAIALYRNTFSDTKNDKYYSYTDKPSSKQSQLEKEYKNINSLKDMSNMKKRVDLITCDKIKTWTNSNIQEQESVVGILREIMYAVEWQKKGGNFVCRFAETFTITSLKLISILMELYDEVYFIKPMTSRHINSERFAVCKGFKLDESKTSSILKKLKPVYDKCKSNSSNQVHVTNIFTDFTFTHEFKTSMTTINLLTSNNQSWDLNRMISFFEESNYHGDTYVSSRKIQIECAEFWNKMFLNKKPDKDAIIKTINGACQDGKKYYDHMLKVLIPRKKNNTSNKSKPVKGGNPKTKKKSTAKSKQSTAKSKKSKRKSK